MLCSLILISSSIFSSTVLEHSNGRTRSRVKITHEYLAPQLKNLVIGSACGNLKKKLEGTRVFGEFGPS